jgi:hypothetical protein
MVTNSGSKFNGKQEGVIVNVELKCQTRLQLVNPYTTSKSKLPPTTAHHAGWMVYGQETLFSLNSCPITNHSG